MKNLLVNRTLAVKTNHFVNRTLAVKTNHFVNRTLAVKTNHFVNQTNLNMYLSRRWHVISRRWFENGSRMVRERLGKVRYFAALVVLLFTIGVGSVWGETFTKITSLSNLTTGDYVIVGQKEASDFGRLTYGTLNSSRIPYSKHYTSVPSTTITTTTANEIWHIVVSGTGDTRTITIYNSGQKKYLNPGISWGTSSSNWTASYSSGFRFKKTDEDNYLGVNKNTDANYWKNYASSTLYNSNTYCLTLYKAPSCNSWSDPTVTYSATTLTAGGAHATVSISGTTYGTITFSSSDEDILTVNSTTGEVTPVSNGSASVTVSWAGNATYCPKDVVINFTVNKASATIKLSEAGAESAVSGTHYSGDSYTLPSSTEATCGTKVLVGWSTVTVAETDAKPTSNFYEKGASVTLSAGENKFYAVFATASGGGGSTTLLSEDFSSITDGNSTATNGSSTNWTVNSNFSSSSSVYQAGGAIRLGNGNNTGYIVTKQLTAAIGDQITIAYKVKGWSSVEGNIQVSGNASEFTQPSATTYTATMSGSFESKSVTVTLTKTNPYIKIATTAKRAFIDDIVITKGASVTYSNYSTSCAACTADPTVGVAQLNGPFSLSSVGVTATGSSAGTNCAWTDYGFVWGTSANPTVGGSGCTKVQVGTSGSATTWDGALTGSFNVGTTYHFRAYGKNGKDGATYQYSGDATFTPRQVSFNLNGHGSSTPSTQYVNNGGKASDPSYSGVVDHWSFEGWYKESACTNAWNFASDVVSGANVTLYAKWTEDAYKTVTFVNNGEAISGYENVKVYVGERPSAPGLDDGNACDETSDHFYGWATDTWSDKIATKAEMEEAHTVYTTLPAVAAGGDATITYHAVWAEGTGAPTITLPTPIVYWAKQSISASTSYSATSGTGSMSSNVAMTNNTYNYVYTNSNISSAPVITLSELNLSSATGSTVSISFFTRGSSASAGDLTVSYSTGADYINIATKAAVQNGNVVYHEISGIPKTSTSIKLTHSKSSGSFSIGTIKIFEPNTTEYTFTELTSSNTSGWTGSDWDGYYLITGDGSTKALDGNGIGEKSFVTVSASDGIIETTHIGAAFKVEYVDGSGYTIKGVGCGDYLNTASNSVSLSNSAIYHSAITYNSITNTGTTKLYWNSSKFGFYSSPQTSPTLYKIMGSAENFLTTCCPTKVTLSSSKTGSGTVTFGSSTIATCDADKDVTMTIAPGAGYQLTSFEVTTGDGKVAAKSMSAEVVTNNNSSAAQDITLTFAKDADGAYDVTATFTVMQDKYYDYMHANGLQYTKNGNYGTVPTLTNQSEASGEDCTTNHYKFKGWVAADEVNEDGSLKTGYTLIAGGTTGKSATNTSYYAVWAEEDNRIEN